MQASSADEDGFGPAEVAQLTGVCEATLERVGAFLTLLEAHRSRLNLIGPREQGRIWRRHVLDSLQLAPLIPSSARALADLGSGAGFPGLVLACHLQQTSDARVYLVEKSPKKSAFLQAAVAQLGLPAIVLTQRAEEGPTRPADVVTARALAPLSQLLALSKGWLVQEGRALFLKGRDAADELSLARQHWAFEADIRPSLSSPEGCVLTVTSLRPV